VNIMAASHMADTWLIIIIIIITTTIIIIIIIIIQSRNPGHVSIP
jgi:hypothetical protein